MSKSKLIAIRLEQSEVESIKAIATEGNVSQWIRLLIKKELESMINFEQLGKEFGTVEYKGKMYWLTQQAYVDNYGTDGEVLYFASAIDKDGTEYKVAWETSEEFDKSSELCTLLANTHNSETDLARIKELEDDDVWVSYCEDESNACDWDDPISVCEI